VSICQKFCAGPPFKGKGGKEGRAGKRREGKRGEGSIPQIKFYDYSTEADELSPAVTNLHFELEFAGIEN
jgi:hypothetical protein